ncbi:MAG TPA: hypothetical protein DDW52_16035, partial [Planctomycetaceae bacterium]|nr:hypothetical protein [Planctomycetaceae bacterium]
SVWRLPVSRIVPVARLVRLWTDLFAETRLRPVFSWQASLAGCQNVADTREFSAADFFVVSADRVGRCYQLSIGLQLCS